MQRITTNEYKKMCALGKAPDVRNQIRGAQNKRNGDLFEEMIKKACDIYKSKAQAFIQKTPEPMKVLKPIPNQPGRFIACFQKKAQPDFKGVLKGGKAVEFDAKHTNKDRIEKSCISSEQADCLDAMMEMDAMCFVAVSFGFNEFFRVPWGVWKNMKQIYGRQYLKPEDIQQYKVPYDMKNGAVMFLNQQKGE